MKTLVMQASSVRTLPRHSWAQIPSSDPYSQTTSACVSPSKRQTRFRAHVKQQPNYIFVNLDLVLTLPVQLLELVFNRLNQRGCY